MYLTYLSSDELSSFLFSSSWLFADGSSMVNKFNKYLHTFIPIYSNLMLFNDSKYMYYFE